MFNLKFSSKQFDGMARKSSKQEQAELLKVKKMIQKGDLESARIYAQNAIRIKNTTNGYLRMASRLDGVASRVESALKMQQVSKQMGAATKGMDKVLATMNLEQIGKVMEKFEASFDNMEIVSSTVEGAMASSVAASTPDDQVHELLQKVSEEHGLEFKAKAAAASSAPIAEAVPQGGVAEAESLEQRLAALRD